MQDTTMSPSRRVYSVTKKLQQEGRIFFFHLTANPQMSSARLLSLTRGEGELLLDFAVGQPPLPFAVFLRL